MMNQMLNVFARESEEVSKERLKEIFDVPKTAELWRKIENHKNYQKMVGGSIEGFFNTIEGTLRDALVNEKDDMISVWSKEYSELAKYRIVNKAMHICANDGTSFNKAVQKAEIVFIRQLNDISKRECEELIDDLVINILCGNKSIFLND